MRGAHSLSKAICPSWYEESGSAGHNAVIPYFFIAAGLQHNINKILKIITAD